MEQGVPLRRLSRPVDCAEFERVAAVGAAELPGTSEGQTV